MVFHFGEQWREVLFGSQLLREFDLFEVEDLVLLLAMGHVDSAVSKLFRLLGLSDNAARFANVLVCAWRQRTGKTFPAEPEAAELLQCVRLMISNKPCCRGGRELWQCPPGVLAALSLRLSCRLAVGSCCTLICWLGTCCGTVVEPPMGYVLCDSAAEAVRAERTVLLSQGGQLGLSLFSLELRLEGRQRTVFASVADSVAARQAKPMQLTALRATVQHSMYRWLGVKWLCTLTPVQDTGSKVAQAELPDCTATAFRDPSAAAEWAELAASLESLYLTRSKSALATAQQVGALMQRMRELMPFSYCKAVQRVMQLPLVDVDISSPGFYVYCLLSPFLGKPYVGAVGLEGARAPYLRLREHVRAARLWSSSASRRRYGHRCPEFYKAFAQAGLGNIVMVFLAVCEENTVRHLEKCYIRQLAPVFNVLGVHVEDALPGAVKRLLGSAASEDVRLVATALLRKNRPRLPVQAWPVLIAQVLRTGDRQLAAKLARQARQVCPQLSRLRAAPRLVFPCPVPAAVLKQLRVEVKAALRALPFVRRTPQFTVMVESTAVCWEKSPYAEVVLSPATLPWEEIGPCRCHSLPEWVPRSQGHAICRSWKDLAWCKRLFSVAGSSSLQCRTYPSLQRIVAEFRNRGLRFFKDAGYPEAQAEEAAASIAELSSRVLEPWLTALPPVFKQKELRAARQEVWRGGLVIVRIDRSPGRVVVMCRELWKALQGQAFLQNPRYVLTDLPLSADDVSYPRTLRDSFCAAVAGSASWVGRSPAGGSARPQCYWTVKQKSLISSVAEPLVKLRPIVTHCRHPLRIALKRVARALAVLVKEARELVLQKRPQHLPMWQLHSGSSQWLQRLSPTREWWGCEEYDVADCFLNTPRGAVLEALDFWLFTTKDCTRRQPCFAISKDGKLGDHRGRPSSVHYWAITDVQLREACAWDLKHNDTFEAQAEADVVVLQQQRGLAIGGHLSAAYVELVALKRELQCVWPLSLSGITSRYRDNFFVVVKEERSAAERERTAADLSALLMMPVKFERAGREARCLELRLCWADGCGLKAVLAYRTDADRQGESGDVRTWPEWSDPRTPALLRGLLAGLAAKLVCYADEAVGGLPASVRRAVQFLRARGYPTRKWLRPFGCELLRRGVPYQCLPKCLQATLRPQLAAEQSSGEKQVADSET